MDKEDFDISISPNSLKEKPLEDIDHKISRKNSAEIKRVLLKWMDNYHKHYYGTWGY